MSKPRLTLVAVLALFGAAQLVPVATENPPVDGEIVVPDEVGEVLRRCCYDCHSHETRWPWYARVAPVSWRVAADVAAARQALNFSRWRSMGERSRRRALKSIWSELAGGGMPLGRYVFVHGDARPTAAELEVLHGWAMGSAQDDLGGPLADETSGPSDGR